MIWTKLKAFGARADNAAVKAAPPSALILVAMNLAGGHTELAVAWTAAALALIALARQEKASATARELREAKDLIKAMQVSGLVVATLQPPVQDADGPTTKGGDVD